MRAQKSVKQALPIRPDVTESSPLVHTLFEERSVIGRIALLRVRSAATRRRAARHQSSAVWREPRRSSSTAVGYCASVMRFQAAAFTSKTLLYGFAFVGCVLLSV